MIPPEIFQRLEILKERAAAHEEAARDERAEIRGMEVVLEAWQIQENTKPVPMTAQIEPRKRRDIREMVREQIVWHSRNALAGVTIDELCQAIPRTEPRRIVDHLTALQAHGEIDERDGRYYPRTEAQDAAQ